MKIIFCVGLGLAELRLGLLFYPYRNLGLHRDKKPNSCEEALHQQISMSCHWGNREILDTHNALKALCNTQWVTEPLPRLT